MSDQQQKSTSMAPGAMASLILGIIGWCTSYIVVGIVLCAIGIAMGGKAKKAIAANPTGYRAAGVAKAGHIISTAQPIPCGPNNSIKIKKPGAFRSGFFLLSE
jgi:hypothetical protein